MKKREATPVFNFLLEMADADLELRAAGKPTLKVEITTGLYNVLITRIAHIFKEVNT